MKLLRIALALVLLSFPAAAGEARFFSQLNDIPLMPGLYEVTKDSVSFDKPEGRIVEASAASEMLKSADILAFYAASLPQLGWSAQGENSYIKDNEKLVLGLEARGNLTILHIGLLPKG